MSTASRKTFFTMIYKAALSGLGFINSALLARTLTMADRAEFQYSGSWAQIGMSYFGGFTNYYAIAMPKYPEDTKRIIQMGNLFVLGASLLTWIVGLILMWAPLPFHLSRPWQWALFVMPLMYIFGFGSRVLQAADEIPWLNRANAAQPFLFTLILIPLFLSKHHFTDHARITLTYVSWAASFVIAAMGTMILAYRLLKLKQIAIPRFNRLHWRGTLSYGGWSSIAQVVNILNYRMDYLLVYNLMPSKDDASLYGIAVVASEVLLNISGSISSVVFRRMTGNDREDAIRVTELATRHTVVSSTIVAIGMYLVFPWLITTAYTAQYAGAIIPFFILLPGLIIKAASNMVIQYATNSLGQAKTAIWMNGVSAIFNALCCVLFIPPFGLIGGAIASTASYALSYIVYVIWFARVNHVSPNGLLVIRKSDLVPYVDMAKKVFRKLLRR